MVLLGIDAHKRNHTVVAVDELGRKLGERTTGVTSEDHLALLAWAHQFGEHRVWAVEDCRHLSRRLERDLLGAGERILGETADIRRFRSRHAFARHNGTAPLPVWSGNRVRHRLSRIGNRQLNAALHRIAITQAHYHHDAREYLQRRRANGDTTTESIRALKRRLSDVIYKALLTDSQTRANQTADRAA